MRNVLKGKKLFLFTLTLTIMMMIFPCSKADAKEGTKDVVLKVAFPETEGFSETDANGIRHGLVVDYLNEIAKYTGWKYEYIETTGQKMIDEFIEGKYDLMGGTFYSPAFEQYFAYPDYNTGYSKAVLMASREDESIKVYDWKSMQGKTIGVYQRAEENIRRLKIFLQSNDLNCDLKYYTRDQLDNLEMQKDLDNHAIDMMLGNSADNSEKYRVAAEFNSQPHYIVTTVGNQEILDGMNMAMEKIIDSNPNFSEECYEANFKDNGIASIYLNSGERDYIAKKKTVSVAVVRSWHPLFCLGTDGDLHSGLIPDVMEKIKEFSGLEFTYKYADNYKEAIELVQSGEADILGSYLGTEEEGIEAGLALTQSYAVLNDIVARNKSASIPSDGLIGAVVGGRSMPADIQTDHVEYFSSVGDALKAVNQGKVDFFYGLSAEMEEEIQGHHYTNVVPYTLVNDRNEMNFAMASPAETELLTIMNKAINSLDSAEKELLVNQNMMAAGSESLTIVELIYANPLMFAGIVSVIFVIVVIFVLVAARLRIRATKMQSSLEKAEASNRAKGEFLSRMSHEIRTPMNAIVGQSNLLCMLDEVPDNVRESLGKIRSSAHYLLSLISDILDMSRIETGMLTIVGETFSIGRIVNELESMMAAEARRKGIEFISEIEVKNDFLIGDEVRLKQVLANLLTNAFKFTPTGGRVQVAVKEESYTEKEATLNFQVTDSGIGISEENQKRIFGAFEQVGSNYSRSQGTGLGLAISKTIVELMGGELKVRSRLNEGSEFYFTVTFPIGDRNAQVEEICTEIDLKNMSVLIAEDNDLNAEIAMELLKMKGASVCRAVNGREAVEMFQNSKAGEFQAILMDIQMPVFDGMAATRAIRELKREDAERIPIIAMTANSFKEDADAAAQAGMDGFVTKPVDVDYLYYILNKAVHKK